MVAVMPIRLVILVMSAPLIILIALIPSVVMAGVTAVMVVVVHGSGCGDGGAWSRLW